MMKRALKCILAALCMLALMPGCAQIPVETTPEPPAATQPTDPPIPENLYGPEDFRFEDGFLSCVAGQATLGIDVSYYQGDIDWEKVKAAGVEFVMVRLGNRGISSGELYEDEKVQQNLTGARAAGLKVGAYFYSQALNVAEAEEEAEKALGILDGFQLDLPLAYDWEQEERTMNVTPRVLTDCTLAFCRVVEAAGYDAMVYFNRYQASELLYLHELLEYPWWLAMYDLQGVFPHKMDMWQYSCTGTVDGITGAVDINLMFE